MRPLRLSVDGFGCFRERQEVDFSTLQLFAIHGPTGAGKSTLLDAVIFALYGRVPRVGPKSTGELISHGRDRMAVTLQFRAAEREFVIARTGRRGRTEVQLDELVGDERRPIDGGVREVDEQIVQIIGLPYEAFIQAVVLPQGDFQRFLKSKPKDRREILTRLLRLEAYERMREAAQKKHDELKAVIKGLDERAAELADITPATLQALSSDVDKCKTATAQADERRVEAEGRLEVVRQRHEHSSELKRLHLRRQDLTGASAGGDHGLPRLEAARRARRCEPALRAIDTALTSQTAAERLASARSQADASARSNHAASSVRLDHARQEAARVAEIEEKIRKLDEIGGLVAARTEAAGGAVRARQERQRLAQALRGEEASVDRTRKSVEAAQNAATLERTALDGIGFDEGNVGKLDGLREPATLLATLRAQTTSAEAEARAAEDRASAMRSAAEVLRKDLDDANARHNAAAERARQLEEAVHAARHELYALELRKGLHAGAACPTCEQLVHDVPEAAKAPDVEALAKRFERARSDSAKTQCALDEKKDAMARAETSSIEAAALATTLRGQSTALNRRLGSDSDALARAFATEGPGNIEDRVLCALRDVGEKRARHQTQLARVAAAGAALTTAQQADALATQALNSTRDRLADAARRYDEAAATLDRLEQRIRSVTTSDDPLVERARLVSTASAIRDALNAAQDAERRAEAELTSTGALLKEAAAARMQADDELRMAEQRALASAREERFDDVAAARAAMLPADEVDRLAKELAAHEHELASLMTRIAEVEGFVGSEPVSDAELLRARDDVTEHREVAQQGMRQLAVLEERLSQTTRQVEGARQVREKLDAARASQQLYEQLALDLRSDRFQAFLLRESFASLLAGASARLMSLTGRYTFAMENEAFLVVDHDNAMATRSADTLSGGETFLASLALALELSDQIQRAAGSNVLDSLFIDEGFGALDPEALEAAAAAIEGLPVGGRMVGIITHLPDLTARLPARILVDRRAEGSKLSLKFD